MSSRIGRLIIDLLERAVLWPLTYLIPRDPKLWVFGSWSGTRFADNAKAAFLYSSAQPNATCVWISRDPHIVRAVREAGGVENRRAYLRLSPLGLWTSLRAGVYVFDVSPNDISFGCSRGARLINLWHGVPLKKIEKDIDTPGHFIREGLHGSILSRLLLRIRQPWMFVRYDLVITTSAGQAPIFASAFDIDPSAVRATGYPRNDVLFAQTHSLARPNSTRRDVRELLYMPTFRDNRPAITWTDEEITRLNILLGQYNAKLTIKLHPIDRFSRGRLDECGHISMANSRLDVYSRLRDVEVLITDYSSIFFDFLLLNRPIIFFCPDLDQYTNEDRGMYFDYESVTPGPKARTFDELFAEIERVLLYRDDFAAQRAAVQARFHDHVDGYSSNRLHSILRNIQGD